MECFNSKNLFWTREPKQSKVTDGRIEITQNRERICGSAHITDSAMTMRLYFR